MIIQSTHCHCRYAHQSQAFKGPCNTCLSQIISECIAYRCYWQSKSCFQFLCNAAIPYSTLEMVMEYRFWLTTHNCHNFRFSLSKQCYNRYNNIYIHVTLWYGQPKLQFPKPMAAQCNQWREQLYIVCHINGSARCVWLFLLFCWLICTKILHGTSRILQRVCEYQNIKLHSIGYRIMICTCVY